MTPEKQEKILQALRAGNYRCTAAQHAGVDVATFKLWISRANKGESLYVDFLCRIKAAEGESEAALVETIKQHSAMTWQCAAWLLERKFTQRWGKRDVSYERAKREEREASKSALAEIPLEELEAMVVAEKARRAA